MCKAAYRSMVITSVRVHEKHGGKSGDWSQYGKTTILIHRHNGSSLTKCFAISKAFPMLVYPGRLLCKSYLGGKK